MNKKPLLFLFFIALAMPFSVLAQTIAVSGKVIAGDDGYGLPGVTIQVKGTSTGTVSDLDGNYNLNADSQDVLVFSYVGYKTKEIAIKGYDLNYILTLRVSALGSGSGGYDTVSGTTAECIEHFVDKNIVSPL